MNFEFLLWRELVVRNIAKGPAREAIEFFFAEALNGGRILE
ncbi:MAG: hypothetical protein ACD_39C00987G0001 [uncultured bacterium]|nr:MAG: hypothetical protein ACD_39C00987G0001 [uncultured bacterium]